MEKLSNDMKGIRLYDIAIFLLYFFTGVIITTSLFFLLGISVNVFNVVLPFIGTAILFYYKKESISSTILILIISTSLLIILILFSAQSFDKTWDGAAYHKQAVGLLKEGWNPVYRSAAEYNELSNSIKYPSDNPLKWAESYPKASWYFASSIYYLTGNIESGKAYTLVFMFVLFAFMFEFLTDKKFELWKKILLSFVAALNPIAMDQFQTYYVDGLATCVLLLLMLQLLTLYEAKSRGKKIDIQINIFLLIIIGCNLKFSVLAFTAICCFIYFALYIWVNRNSIKQCINCFVYFALSAIFSIGIVGFAPYITNVIRYKNPLYSFTGLIEGSRLEQEFGIIGLDRSGRALASLFGKMSHGEHNSLKKLLKVPFTFEKNELAYYYYPDVRVSGLGIFFSGIFIVSLLFITAYVIRHRKKLFKNDFMQFSMALLFAIAVMIELLTLEATYQFRYVGHFYGIAILALYLLLKTNNLSINKYVNKIAAIAIITIMFINILPWMKISYERIQDGITYQNELESLGGKTDNLTIAFYSYDFSGMHYNLKDYGINSYNFVDMSQFENQEYKSIFGNWIMYVEN